MRKKLVAVLACGVLATGMLAGCGGSDDKKEDTKAEATAEATEEPEATEAAEEVTDETDAEGTDAEATGLTGMYVATMVMSDEEHSMTISDYTEQSGDETFASIEGATIEFVDDATLNEYSPNGEVKEGSYAFDGQYIDITDEDGTESYEYNSEYDYITYAIPGEESTMYVVFSHEA